MSRHIITGVHIVDREKHASIVQQVFTKYGECINTRLGIHDTINPSNGLIIVEMEDSADSIRMIDELEAMSGVECQTMIFNH